MGFGDSIKKGVLGTKKLFGDIKEALEEQESNRIQKKEETLRKLKEQNAKASKEALLDKEIAKEKAKNKNLKTNNDMFQL